jgi:NTE family protein
MPNNNVAFREIDQKRQRLPFERVALFLQGGGALGSYQAGAYQALAEANLHPDWVAGISIGAMNSALIAGNAPEKRVERLRDFWEAVSSPPLGPFGLPYNPSVEIKDEAAHQFVNQMRAWFIVMLGVPGFFRPRLPQDYLWGSRRPDALSFYGVTALQTMLERLVDFDRINDASHMRFSVGAVNVGTGNFVYFDNTTHRISVAHVMASGSLPPGLPATEIDGQYYWDGGVISNTPLQWVLDSRPRMDTLAFQVDLWTAHGPLPHDLIGIGVRLKDIMYSSRTRAATDQYKKMQKLRIALADVIHKLPPELRTDDDVKLLAAETDNKVCNIVHLIYRCKGYEGIAKDFEFSRRTMEEHWTAGYNDTVRALGHPEVLQLPDRIEGVRTFDFAEV